MPPTPQRIGRYEIRALVGRGGMGVLYRAADPVLERIVALKMMHVDFSLDQAAHERFQREAKAIARLQHTNVVTVHELGEVDGAPDIVMEFLGGQDLDALLKSGTPISLAVGENGGSHPGPGEASHALLRPLRQSSARRPRRGGAGRGEGGGGASQEAPL